MKAKTTFSVLFLLVLSAVVGVRSLLAYDHYRWERNRKLSDISDGLSRIGGALKERNYIEQDKVRTMQKRNYIEQDKVRMMQERNRIEQQRVNNEADEAHRSNFFRQIETFYPNWRDLYNDPIWGEYVLKKNSDLFNPFFVYERKNAFGKVLGRYVKRVSPKYAIELLRDIYRLEEEKRSFEGGEGLAKHFLNMAHFLGGYDIKWKNNEDVRWFCYFIYMAEYLGAKISKADMRWINHRTTYKIRSEELRRAIKHCKGWGWERGGGKITKNTDNAESQPQKIKTNVKKKSSENPQQAKSVANVKKSKVEKRTPVIQEEEWE